MSAIHHNYTIVIPLNTKLLITSLKMHPVININGCHQHQLYPYLSVEGFSIPFHADDKNM